MAWWCGLSCRVGERCSLPPNPSEKTKTLAAYEQPGSQARTAMGGRGDGGLPPYYPSKSSRTPKVPPLSLSGIKIGNGQCKYRYAPADLPHLQPRSPAVPPSAGVPGRGGAAPSRSNAGAHHQNRHPAPRSGPSGKTAPDRHHRQAGATTRHRPVPGHRGRHLWMPE